MRAQTIASLILLMATGCNDPMAATPPAVAPSPPIGINADQYIASWTNMGMWLPDDKQITFFRSQLTQTKDKLEAALAAKEIAVRQRAAYVIQKIGKDAQTLGPELLAQLRVEPERLVRIYIINALAAVRYGAPDVIMELARRFDSLSAENVPRNLLDHEYTDVDEKINIAAAIYILQNDADKERYLQFVEQWLRPPESDLSSELLRGYWERRWMAVISLEEMRGATSAMPLLEAMLKEKSREPWVDIHVPPSPQRAWRGKWPITSGSTRRVPRPGLG